MKQSLLFFFILFGSLAWAQEPARIKIDTDGDVHPWNMLEVNNDPNTFQFAIVTDRTGGLRPGIFPVAVDKLNLLQPEFVMSVGDLITGYTEDEKRIDREWDEFTGFINKLEMPFFYVPGNHDYINDVMAQKWKERFGKDYYHFIYKDVLFLCLNTEEKKRGAGRGYIDQPQYDYVKKTLEANQDVKWTLVFMHQPLWDQKDNGMWADVENLLKDRKHTVYVGHRHRFVKYERNNSKYFILATTGGGSGLRGPAFGEFDHVVWITMTDDGPIMANLLLDGIWDENVQTEEAWAVTRKLTGADLLEVKPMKGKEGKFKEGTLTFKINNPADIPLKVEVELNAPTAMLLKQPVGEVSIGPNSVKELSFELAMEKETPINSLTSNPFKAEVEFTYERKGAPELSWEKEVNVLPLDPQVIEVAGKKVKIDGKLKEWESLKLVKTPFVDSDPFAHTGKKDASFSFDIKQDDDYLYLAMEVMDDELILSEKGDLFTQDAAVFQLDARPMEKVMNGEEGRYYRDWIILGISPNPDGSAKLFRPDLLPEGVEYSCKLGDKSYTVEFAVPLNYMENLQGSDWGQIRINAGVHDVDKGGEHDSRLFWQADWMGDQNILGSGIFVKE
ncbi:MAG: metallophosphoesterase [Bacteroidia bacterium]|nr:metallophosphoesterase [Bacteroidia bacterium]